MLDRSKASLVPVALELSEAKARGYHIQLVDGNSDLAHPQRANQQRMLLGLAATREPALKLTWGGVHDKDGYVRLEISLHEQRPHLRSTRDHVGDEVPMSGRIQDRDVMSGGLELRGGHVDGDAPGMLKQKHHALPFPLAGHFIQHPGKRKGLLAHLLGISFKALDGAAVHHTCLVQQMAHEGGFPGIHVA